MHLLKWIFQENKRTNSWAYTIAEQRNQLHDEFRYSKNLYKFAKENFHESYEKAKKNASKETGSPLSTFPEEPPFTFEQVIDEKYLP